MHFAPDIRTPDHFAPGRVVSTAKINGAHCRMFAHANRREHDHRCRNSGIRFRSILIVRLLSLEGRNHHRSLLPPLRLQEEITPNHQPTTSPIHRTRETRTQARPNSPNHEPAIPPPMLTRQHSRFPNRHKHSRLEPPAPENSQMQPNRDICRR